MDKALQGEAVVLLPRALNNAGHGSLRLARRGKCFQNTEKMPNIAILERPGSEKLSKHFWTAA